MDDCFRHIGRSLREAFFPGETRQKKIAVFFETSPTAQAPNYQKLTNFRANDDRRGWMKIVKINVGQ
jgi:hypothetical protein